MTDYLQFDSDLVEIWRRYIQTHFKDDYGNPYIATDYQMVIFLAIVLKPYQRVQVITPTQAGKSDIVSMALIVRSEAKREQFAIVSGSQDKSMIIMGRVLQHTFDNYRYYSKLELDATMPLDRLRRERSKDRISWLSGGGIRTFTANTKNRNSVVEALTGFGAQNVIEDEAALIPNDAQAMVMRMLGGHKESFLLKIGNPFFRNHFFKTWNSPKYRKVFVDYNDVIRAGRFTKEFIEEMRDYPFFDVLYECKFPGEDEVLPGGWRKLFPSELLKSAFITEEEFKREGQGKLGGDFAGAGRDRNAYVGRWGNYMKLLSTNKVADTMQQVVYVEEYKERYDIEDQDIGIDYGGLGQGVGDRLDEKGIEANKIMFGSSAPEGEKHKYLNMRAYMYYQLLKWLQAGGKIVEDEGFSELEYVYYKSDSDRKLQIIPKEELKKLMQKAGVKASSPDVADASVLTFADSSEIITEDDIG